MHNWLLTIEGTHYYACHTTSWQEAAGESKGGKMKSRLKRVVLGVSALGMVATSAVFSGTANAATCSTTTKINMGAATDAVASLPLNVALEYDIDAKYCLDISVTYAASSSVVRPALAAKTIDMAFGTIDNFMTWQGTTPLTVFREIQTAPFFDVVVRKDFYEANLKGKTYVDAMKILATAKLGVTSAGGASEATWRQLISGASTTLTGALIPGALSAATVAAQFTAKTMDAAMTWEPNTTLLTEGINDGDSPLGVMPFSLKQPTKEMPAETNTPGLSLGARTEWFLANQNVAKQVDAMFDEAVAWARTPKNFANVVSSIQKNSKISNTRAISLGKTFLNYLSPSGAINRAAWDLTGPWFAANLPKVVNNTTFTSANFVYDFSERQVKALKVRRTYSSADLAKALDLVVRPGSVITLTTTTPSTCKASKTGVEGKKEGTCDLTVTVTDKKAVGQQSATRFARTFLIIKK